MDIPYERVGDLMVWNQEVEGQTVRYQATAIRQESGKPKALCTIVQGGRILEEDDIALGRREERIRLANAAHKNLNGLGKVYPADRMQHDFLLFCRGLYPAWLGESGAVWTKGDLEPSEPDFLVHEYALRDAGTIMFAPPGMGKSWTALILAVCVDAGLSHLVPVQQVPVEYVNLERSEASFSRRLGMVNEALGLPRDRPLLMHHARGRSLTDVFDAVQRDIQKEGVGLTFIDSLSRAGGGSLIKDDVANKSMDMANALGSAWWFLAHTPRQDETHAFGSQMFDAAADVTLQLRSQEMDDPTTGSPLMGVSLRVEKANDIAKARRRIWTYEFDRRFGITGVREAERGEWPELEDDGAPSPQDRIVEALRYGEMYVAEIAEAIGKDASNVSTYLKDMLANGKVRQTRKDGNRQYYGLPDRRHNQWNG